MLTSRALVAQHPEIVAYFRHGRKPRNEWRIGAELEKICVDAKTGRTLPFEGPGATISRVLEHYRLIRGGRPVLDRGRLVGLRGDWGGLSLEPGGQVEWASHACSGLYELSAGIEAHLGALDELAERLGARFLEVAINPGSDVQWMPHSRVTLMKSYMAGRGRLAHRTMTDTASLQCAFDYSDEIDWWQKMRAVALLAPVALAIFANSTHTRGSDSGFKSFRHVLWRETDSDRCLLPDLLFHHGAGWKDWSEWVVSLPAILDSRGGKLVGTDGRPFCQLKEEVAEVQADAWRLQLSTVLTYVRSYTYIEIRCMDLPPDRHLVAAVALWCGLLYQPEALTAALDLGKDLDNRALWLQMADAAARDGLDGEAEGTRLRDLAHRMFEIAALGLRGGAKGADLPGDPAAPLVQLAEDLGLALTPKRRIENGLGG